MPYSEYRVKDRQALAQLKYQIRRFKKQMIACGTSQENVDKIHDSLWSSLILAHGSDDFDDDGTSLPKPILSPCRCGNEHPRLVEAE